MDINEDKVENTPTGGVLVGKKDGQTIIHDKGTMSGYLVGKLHKDGGIKAVNKATGQPLEMQGGEVVITAPAVSDQTKREFEGKMMTNREILSAINEKGGGVSFANGGDIPAKIHTNDCEYKLGGKVVKDTDIAQSLGMNSTLKKGKQHFTSGDTTYDVDAIYNAIKKGKLRLKTKEVETFPMKYPVYDKKYSETLKTDFRKPNGITVLTESGEEVLIDGNHRMNNAYLKGKKTMKTYYIEDPKQISKFSKKNKFELGGENKVGGHLSSGKSLKQIAEMHNVSLAHINEQLAKGLEVEKEHFADFKERTRVAKDHLVENPNYYTILAKAGLKRGGKIEKEDLVEDAKSGNTPARDLNNYNDLLDVQADGAVGGDSGIYAKGGVINKENVKSLEKDFLGYTDNSNYKGLYDEDEIDNGITLEWGKYGYGVSEDQQDDDYQMLRLASIKFNVKNIGKFYSVVENSDKYNTVNILDYDMLAKDSELVSNLPEKYFAKLKVGRGKNQNVIDRLETQVKKSKDLEAVDVISKKLEVSQKEAKEIVDSLQYDKEYYEKNKSNRYTKFGVFYMQKLPHKEFKNLDETLDFIKTDDFINSIYNSANPRIEVIVNLYDWGVLTIKYDEDSRPYKSDGSTDWNSRGRTLNMYPYIAINVSSKQDFTNALQKGISDFIWCYKYYVLGADEKKKIEEVDDLSELLEMVKSGNYANGGITPYDANSVGDSVPILDDEFAKGGVIYDTTKPTVDKITIKETKFDGGSNLYSGLRENIVGKEATNISYFINLIKDYVGQNPLEETDWLTFYVNDGKRGTYYIDLNKDKKNTVKNVNPKTGGGNDIKRVIDANKNLAKNYNWTEFFYGQQTKKDNSVIKISVTYDSKVQGAKGGVALKNNTLELYEFLRGLHVGEYVNVQIQPIGNSLGVNPVLLNLNTFSWDNLLTMSPQETALKEINRILYGLFPELNFDAFVRASSSANASQTNISTSNNDNFVDVVRLDYQLDAKNYFSVSCRNLKELLEDFAKIEYYCVKNPDATISVEITAEVTDNTGRITAKKERINIGKDAFKPSNFSYDEVKELIQEEWFDNQLDFANFFKTNTTAQTPIATKPVVDSVVIKDKDIVPYGQNVYRGSGLLPLFESIYDNNVNKYAQVELDVVVNGIPKNLPLNLKLVETAGYDWQFNPMEITEEELEDRIKKDWLPEYDWETFFHTPQVDFIKIYDVKDNSKFLAEYKNISDFLTEISSVGFNSKLILVEVNGIKTNYSNEFIYINDGSKQPNIDTNDDFYENVIQDFEHIYPNYDWSKFGLTYMNSYGKDEVMYFKLLYGTKCIFCNNPNELFVAIRDAEQLAVAQKDQVLCRIYAISKDEYGIVNQIFDNLNIEDGFIGKIADNYGVSFLRKWIQQLFKWKDSLLVDKFFEEKAPVSTSIKPFDFTDTKIDVEDNPELSQKVQKRAFELGWEWENNGGKTIDYNDFNYLYFTKTSISSGNTTSSFTKSPKRKITEQDIFGSQANSTKVVEPKPYELSKVTVEWKGNSQTFNSGKELIEALRTIERLNNGQNVVYDVRGYGYDSNSKEVSSVIIEVETDDVSFVRRNYSDQDIKSKIEGWIDGFNTNKFFEDVTPLSGSQAPANTKKEVKTVEIFVGLGNEIFCENAVEFYDALMEFENKFQGKDVSATIYVEGKNSSTNTDFNEEAKIMIGENYFQPSELGSVDNLKNVAENWFNKQVSFNNFFNTVSAQAPATQNQTFDLSDTKIWIGDNPELSEKIQRRAFELGWDWVDKIKKIQETDRACMYFSGTNLHNILISSNDRSDFDKSDYYREITVDELFGNQTPTSTTNADKDVQSVLVTYAGGIVYTALNQERLKDKIVEIWKDGGRSTTAINLQPQGFVAKLSNPVTVILDNFSNKLSNTIEPSNISISELKELLSDNWFPELVWSDFFNEKTKPATKEKVMFLRGISNKLGADVSNVTELRKYIEDSYLADDKQKGKVTLNVGGDSSKGTFYISYGSTFSCSTCFDIQTDGNKRIQEILLSYEGADKFDWSDFFQEEKIIETGVSDLGEAIKKLEKASSKVATEYNRDAYDKSLKFLYDTKATYELALKFTPESAFMYERLDILKKLADLEKSIKKIEDMKKGGAFYMLAQILEKLQRGENWRTSENAQDVITNQLPQSEIDVIIRSQKFKNWFGDWEKALVNDEYDNVSKALTDGVPSVYHHGARRIKYTYREVSNGVLYLAENISYAIWFSQNSTAQSEEGNYLTDCFVNIKNPIDLTAFHVNQIDLGDLVRYIDAIYPLARIYDFIPAQVALLIKTNQPTNVRMWAWQLIRSYAKFVNHIKENTPYDGFLYYENNPSDQVINPVTGQSEENVTKAVAIFKSHQVKVVDAVLFDGGLDDWRFENGGKINN